MVFFYFLNDVKNPYAVVSISVIGIDHIFYKEFKID